MGIFTGLLRFATTTIKTTVDTVVGFASECIHNAPATLLLGFGAVGATVCVAMTPLASAFITVPFISETMVNITVAVTGISLLAWWAGATAGGEYVPA